MWRWADRGRDGRWAGRAVPARARQDLSDLDVTAARITLVEAADQVLGSFHDELSERADRTLVERGVNAITSTPVSRVECDAVHLADGRTIATRTVVCAAGVRANPVATLLGVELGRGGRILAAPDLSATEPMCSSIGPGIT